LVATTAELTSENVRTKKSFRVIDFAFMNYSIKRERKPHPPTMYFEWRPAA